MPRDPAHIKKLADFFECSVHFLLYGDEDPNSLINQILHKTTIHTGLYEVTVRKVNSNSSDKGEK